MTVRILRGDCREVLRTLPDESVHTVVTSPPYWGLRDYGLPPSMWGGEASCEHDFGPVGKIHRGGANGGGAATIGRDQSARDAVKDFFTGQTCMNCGAWRGCLGLEPTPQMYVEHLVDVFREVRRVLRSDGTLLLNMGDAYSSGGRGALEGGRASQEASMIKRYPRRPPQTGVVNGTWQRSGNDGGARIAVPGLAPKQLIGMPWRLAFALQVDGWYLRQDIIWHKPNPMPESVRDRCTKAHEYLFLLSKSGRYYFDAEAIKEPASENTHARYKTSDGWDTSKGEGSHRSFHKKGREKGKVKIAAAGSGIKANDSMSPAINGPTVDRNKRSVWTVATQPFKEAHFATFPPALIEPCILAGSPRGGVVLDPFGGAGTTGLVAARHGRDAILIELNEGYAAMAEKRIHGDAPLPAEAAA